MSYRRHFAPLVLVVTLGACTEPPECAVDDDCAGEQVCAVQAGRSQCASLCNADQPCDAGFACQLDVGSERPICFEVLGTLEEGTGCSNDTQCLSGICEAVVLGGTAACQAPCAGDVECDAAERCFSIGARRLCAQPVADLELGEPCEVSFECSSGRCASLPHLDAAQGQCVATCAGGEVCDDDEVCAQLQIGLVCARLAEDGELCAANETCATGSCIIDEVQDDARLCASSCDVAGTCAEGFACVRDNAEDPLCLPVLDAQPAGETCASARDCVSGHCGNFGGEFGAQCADPCDETGACVDQTRVCYQTEVGPDLCGPVP